MDSATRGLTTAEAQVRLHRFGPNAAADAEDHGIRHVLAGIAAEPMFQLLLAARGSIS